MMTHPSILRSLRLITGCGLLGAVLAGTFFGWIGTAGVHEAGAVVGLSLGIVANAKHLA